MSIQPNPAYLAEDFVSDMLWLGRLGREPLSGSEILEEIGVYFRGRYQDAPTAATRMLCCQSAFDWWQRNREAFDRGKLSVVGDERALVTNAVIAAIWFYWTQNGHQPLDFDPPSSDVAVLAERLI